MMLKAIIVDDEELAIDRLSELLLETGKVELLKSFLEPEGALLYIKETSIDVAFLDIALPGLDGLMLADRIINIDSNIDVVFVTGYNKYAVKAFELNALDYLMKPVTEERLEKTIEKLVKNISPKSVEPGTRIICLGGFDLYMGDNPQTIKWRTSKAAELLAFLIHNGGKTVSRDYLMEQLWEGTEPAKAMASLNVATYNLRKALNNLGLKDCIKTSKSDIWLEAEKLSCDLYVFEGVLKENPVVNLSNIGEIEKAIGLYQGEYLKNKDYNWADQRRFELEKAYLNILVKVSEYYFNEGSTASAVESLKRVLSVEPLQEEIHEKLIRIYHLCGLKVDAEKQYKLLKTLLAEELDIEPSREIKSLMGYK